MTVVGDKTSDVNDKVVDTEATAKKPAAEEAEGIFKDIDKETPMDVENDKSKEVLSAAQLPGRVTNNTEERLKVGTDSYTPNDLMITPEEKSAFIDAMITGERYRQTFSLFGGKITVKIRSRVAAETHAMYSYIRHSLANGGAGNINAVEGDMAYVPLVAQIEELNGKKFPEMKEPLTFVESEGKETPPGWFEDFKAWKSKPEGLTSALISCIQLFEYKYWMMTKEATNKNFWNSDTSIAE